MSVVTQSYLEMGGHFTCVLRVAGGMEYLSGVRFRWAGMRGVLWGRAVTSDSWTHRVRLRKKPVQTEWPHPRTGPAED